ncbi:unnamed protein product, partial [Iphiclides podalirius]
MNNDRRIAAEARHRGSSDVKASLIKLSISDRTGGPHGADCKCGRFDGVHAGNVRDVSMAAEAAWQLIDACSFVRC